METQIKQVQKYFKAQILEGNYTVSISHDNNLLLTVDKKYHFTFFCYKSIEDILYFSTSSFINLYFNEAELIYLSGELRDKFFKLLDSKIKGEKLEQLKRLKDELKNKN